MLRRMGSPAVAGSGTGEGRGAWVQNGDVVILHLPLYPPGRTMQTGDHFITACLPEIKTPSDGDRRHERPKTHIPIDQPLKPVGN